MKSTVERRWLALAVIVAAAVAGCTTYDGKNGDFSRGRSAELLDSLVRDTAHSGVCKSGHMPQFPWPAPEPTSAMRVHRRLLSLPTKDAPKTLGAVFEHVRDRVTALRYPPPTVLGAGCNGFAMILPMERLQPDGRRLAGQDGFAGPGQRTSFNIADLIRQLLEARPGFYRTIVIVVTNQEAIAVSGALSHEELKHLQIIGKDEITPELAALRFGELYSIYALVYEFEYVLRVDKNVPQRVQPEGRLPAMTHLSRAGLIDATFLTDSRK